MMNWISVKSRLPEKETEVLVFYTNEYKRGRIVKAEYVRKLEREIDFDTSSFGDTEDTYDAETDTSWWPEGWYECPCENGDDETKYWRINPKLNEITHWMPLLPPPHKESA